MQRADSEKTLMLEKIEGRRRRGATEDEMVGWNHQLNGHEFGQALGDGEGQGGLACYSLWGRRESDTTERLSNKTRLCSRQGPYVWTIVSLHMQSESSTRHLLKFFFNLRFYNNVLLFQLHAKFLCIYKILEFL